MSNAMNDASTEKDELEKIMSEIEELQHEMEVTSTVSASVTTTAAPVGPAPSSSIHSPSSIPTGSLSGEIAEVLTEVSDEDILKEIQASAQIDDSDMEATLSQLKGDDSGAGLLDSTVDSALDRAVASTAASTIDNEKETTTEGAGEMSMSNQSNSGGNSGTNSSGNSDGSLTLTLTGNMTLKLKYEFEGQEVMVSFADQALSVKMSDGTEFKVPVARLANTAATTTANNVKPFKKTG